MEAGREVEGSSIAYVPQGREIFPYLTVRENLVVGLEARGEKAVVPDGIFESVPRHQEAPAQEGWRLERRRAAGAARHRPCPHHRTEALLLDEPTEGIQPSIVFEIENTIRFIKEQGKPFDPPRGAVRRICARGLPTFVHHGKGVR